MDHISKVVVLSGLNTAGKSTMLNRILKNKKYAESPVVMLDYVRKKYLGERELSDIEHVFKNEATIFEIKSKLISERPNYLFSELTMMTHSIHQKPFLNMIADLQSRFNMDVRPIIFYLYCDLESVKRRLFIRRENVEKGFGTEIFHLDGFLKVAWLYQWPVDYVPYAINTSDDAMVNQQEEDMIKIIEGDENIDDPELNRRAAMARANLFMFKDLAKPVWSDQYPGGKWV